jgi:hypothetical protein
MRITRPLVEGPEFAQRALEAEQVVARLVENNWDFAATPEVFSPAASADVLAKEIVHIHDGRQMTRLGYLVMGGAGEQFNLMGPIPANAQFRIGGDGLVREIHRQLKTKGLQELAEFRELGRPERVQFYNYSNFFQLRDLVHWLVLHGAGCFPSTLEIMVRHFAAGNIVQNNMYRPRRPSNDQKRPAVMQAACMSVTFPSEVIEWMDKPIYGGLQPNTIHIEYLLTPEPSSVSHPYLKLDGEGVVTYRALRYHLRRFVGITPKDGLRGLEVPPEGKEFRR